MPPGEPRAKRPQRSQWRFLFRKGSNTKPPWKKNELLMKHIKICFPEVPTASMSSKHADWCFAQYLSVSQVPSCPIDQLTETLLSKRRSHGLLQILAGLQRLLPRVAVSSNNRH